MKNLKKDQTAPQKAVGDFLIKDGKGKQVIIEGFANKAVSDRIGDLIPPDAWELDNFKKNPIIFFNHDRNIPIGKAIDTKITDEGLKIKVRISKSDQAPIPFIRDMIEEGILKTFSVGFDDHESAFKSDEGHNSFKRAELLETSVVTIPMNQESDFELVSLKSDGWGKIKTKSDLSSWKDKSYSTVVRECLSAKGAYVAAVAKSYIDIDPDHYQDFEVKFHDYLNGEKQADDEFIEECAERFSVSATSLHDLNKKADMEEEEEEEEDKKEGEEEEEEDKKKQEDEEEEEDKKEDEDDKKKQEDEEEEEEKEENNDKADFQDCVAGKIPKFMEEGMERDKAVAAAISSCQEGKSCDLTPSKDDLKLFCDIADKSAKAEEEEKKKQADLGEGESESVPIDEKTSEFDIGQPSIDLQKSSLALQGSQLETTKALVEAQNNTNELLSAMLEIMKNGPTTVETVEESKAEDEEEEEEDQEEDQEKRLKRMGEVEKKISQIEKIQAYHEKLDKLMVL